MKVGYSRVSTNEQDVDQQHAFLIAAGVDEDRIYTDVAYRSHEHHWADPESLATLALESGDPS